MNTTEIVWMSLQVHPRGGLVAQERYSSTTPSLPRTSATMLVTDGGFRLALRGAVL